MADTHTLEVEGREEACAGNLSSTASHLRDNGSEIARALGKIDEQRENTASVLQSAAAKIHAAADAGPGKISGAMHSVARGVGSAAAFLRENDTRRMLSDVEHLIRRNPAPSLLIAAGIGFLAGRALRKN